MDRHGSHSQRVPYARKEGRKSLFSKVKDSVKDMLSPSWLSDLVSNVKKDSDEEIAQKRQQEMYKNPVSTSQRLPQPDIPQQPNVLPFQNQGMPLGNGQPHMMEFSNRGPPLPGTGTVPLFQQPIIPPPVSEFTSSQLPLARLTEKSDSVLANDDSVSQRSDASKSTSGCSSMVPQGDAGRRGNGLEKRKASEPEVFSGGSSPSSAIDQPTKRQRLQVSINSSKTWTRGLGDSFSKAQTPAAVNKPSFNTSLFGCPLSEDSSILGSSFHDSSFYPGKTTFGGRSSMSFRSKRNKVDLNQSLPARLSIPVKAFMKAKPKVNPAKEAVTSSTAKRILDALDKMPTPLNDAKKIPITVPKHWTDSPSFFSRDRPLSRSGPPTQKLNISSLASISQNRQISTPPVKRPTQPSTSQNEHIPKMLPSRDETIILAGPGAPSGKMRRDKSYHRGSAAVAGGKPELEEEDTMIIPNLTTDFTLPVASMPKFNFSTPEPYKSASTPAKPALNFTFSSPIAEKVPADKPKSPESKGGFQFSSPLSVDKQTASGTSSQSVQQKASKSIFAEVKSTSQPQKLTSKAPFSFTSPMNTSTDRQFSPSAVAPKPKSNVNGPFSVSDAMQPASELKQGSVMDILGGGSPFSPSSFGGMAPASELKQGSVMDILGGSGFKSTDSALSKSSAPINGPMLGDSKQAQDKAKQSETSDACLLKNKSEDIKCVACQSPKPDGSQSSKTDSSKSSAPLNILFKTSGWTCDACLVKNNSDVSKCVACQSPKPGAAGSAKTAPPLSSAFKSQGWSCGVCLVQNKQESQKCVACQAAKPGASMTKTNTSGLNELAAKFKPATGQWECEVCLVRNKSELAACAACQTPKPLKAFKHPPGDWTCDTCLVVNKESNVKCVACSYARPGPPRTQTVPSCVKTFTKSQNSGFSVSTDDGKAPSIVVGSGGGFKLLGGEKTNSDKGGFTFGPAGSDKLSGGSTATTGSGFKFGGSTSSSGTGFKFGGKSETKADASTGGFTFNTGKKVDEKQTNDEANKTQAQGGFKFGASAPVSSSSISSENKNSDSSTSVPSGGFSFGQTNSESKTTAPSTGSVLGGFSLNKTTENKTADPLKTATPAAGGFAFKASDSTVSAKPSDSSSQPTSLAGTQSIGGFNFSATSKSENSTALPVQTSSVTSNAQGGFTFTATKLTQSSTVTGAPSAPTNSKPSFGGFSFGSTPANTSQPATFGGFNFAQKPTVTQEGSNSTTSGTSLKRDRDDDSSATAVKKSNVAFGATPVSSTATPFQFGAANSNSTPASVASTTSNAPFVFGQPNTSVSSAFSFTASKPTATPTPVFGAASTTAQSGSTAPVFGTSFNFTGQKTESSAATTSAPLFVFGAQSTQQTSSGTGQAFGGFGSTSSSFGALNNSAFGGNAPSTTPAFGSTPPAFGSTNTSSAAPAFGAFNNTPAAPAQTNAVFQFGAKPAETPQTNAGFNFNPAGMGSQPSFNFGATTAPGTMAFSAQPSSTPQQGERKIKKAVRKIRR